PPARCGADPSSRPGAHSVAMTGTRARWTPARTTAGSMIRDRLHLHRAPSRARAQPDRRGRAAQPAQGEGAGRERARTAARRPALALLAARRGRISRECAAALVRLLSDAMARAR